MNTLENSKESPLVSTPSTLAAWRVYATLLASVEHIVKAVEFAKVANPADDADVQEKTAAIRAALSQIKFLTGIPALDPLYASLLGQPSASREDI